MDGNSFESVKLIVLFSGKRKSGKDYIVENLQERILDKDKITVIRLSGPIKQVYAKDHHLDYSKLLDSSDYKEKHRLDMIKWSEAKRSSDTGYFIRPAIDMYQGSSHPVWVVSDMRRRTDLQWFRDHFGEKVFTVRVRASEETRKNRGWIFTEGVDDAESECDLDSITQWDKTVQNDGDGDKQTVERFIDELIQIITDKTK